MRGEGTRVEANRSIPEFKACLSCTCLFHHRDTETRRKTKERNIEVGHQS
jgi:hypothetical protein